MKREWEEAARHGHVDTLQRLLGQGADVDARDGHGQTALQLAALAGHVESVRLLISHGADLDHTAKYALSALMLAVLNGRSEIVRVLVEAGADRELRGSGPFHDKTALDLATAASHPDLDATCIAALKRPAFLVP